MLTPQRKMFIPDLTSLFFPRHPSAQNFSQNAGPFRPRKSSSAYLERCRHMVIHIASAPIGCLKNEAKNTLLDINCQVYSYGFGKRYFNGWKKGNG